MKTTAVGDVMTVCGTVPAGCLGFTLTHEHLMLDKSKATGRRDGFLYDRALGLRELELFKAAGGRTIVDLSNGEMDRCWEPIQWLAQRSGLHIIVGCGWYHEGTYERTIWSRTTADLAGYLVKEIEYGLDGTGIRPGVIGEIGCDGAFVSPAEERVFRAVARAQKRTGLAVMTHAVDSPVGLAHLDLLAEEGADLRRVAVGHCATWPDPDYHEAIARRGAYVQFDVGGRVAHETDYQLRQVLEVIRRGYLEHILLSHDLYLRSQLTTYGGKGYAYVISGFVEVLRKAGLSQEQIDTIFIGNPRRLLSGA